MRRKSFTMGRMLSYRSKGAFTVKALVLSKLIGISVLAFGAGILISFFLPETVLAVIEAFLIVAIGVLFFLKPKC